MDLTKHQFPEVNGLAFSIFKTDKALLAEAKERGFYNGNTHYNKLFSKLFFGGGKVKFKEGVRINLNSISSIGANGRVLAKKRTFTDKVDTKH